MIKPQRLHPYTLNGSEWQRWAPLTARITSVLCGRDTVPWFMSLLL